MTLLYVVLVLICVGVLLWLMNQYVPMDARIKNLIGVLVVIVAIPWVLDVAGIISIPFGIRLK